MAARVRRALSPRDRAQQLRGRVNLALSLAAGTLVAAVLGVTLGHSAIGEINPIYFQPVEPVRVYQPPPPAQDIYASSYGWENGQAAMIADCGANCGGGIATYNPPAVATGGAWRDSTPTTELAPWPPGQVSARRVSQTVERYSHYPVAEGDTSGAAALKVPSDGLGTSPPPDDDDGKTAPAAGE